MKKPLIILFAMMMPVLARANDEAIAEIRARYTTARTAALEACGGIADQIEKIKILAGVSTISSGVGFVAGGVALTTGLIKMSKDTDVAKFLKEHGLVATIRAMAEMINEPTYMASVSPASANEEFTKFKGLLYNDEKTGWLDRTEEWRKTADANEDKRVADLEKAHGQSQALGTARTATSFVAGGTAAVSAGVSLGTAFAVDFDQLKADMQTCESRAAQINTIRTELMGEDMFDPQVAAMDKIIDACKGFNVDNVDVVKRNLMIGGIVSVVGAGTGIAGGVVSHQVGKAEADINVIGTDDNKSKNMAANVLAGVSAGASLAAGLLTGIPLVQLNRNADIAKRCVDAF